MIWLTGVQICRMGCRMAVAVSFMVHVMSHDTIQCDIMWKRF